VECRTPLATLRYLFLAPARRCEPKKWDEKEMGEKKHFFGAKKILGSKKIFGSQKNMGAIFFFLGVAFPLKMSHSNVNAT
jgi:hypothetical protein